MSAAQREYASTRFFASLDGLRALSILAVMWFHTWFNTPQFGSLVNIPILQNGTFGVDVFFAISGFLITTLLIRERERYGKISLTAFYLRRALRIWPLYYSVLALYVILTVLTEHGTARGHAFFRFLPSYLTYTYTWFGPYGADLVPPFNFAWSLSTEEQFYLFWPFAVAFLRTPYAIVAMIVMVVLRIAAGFGLMHDFLPEASLVTRIMMSISVPLCLGALLAHAMHSSRCFRIIYWILGRKMSAVVALVAMAATIPAHTGTFTPIFWLALCGLVGACVIREDNSLARFLRFKPIAVIGTVSYGMYLFNTLTISSLRWVLNHVGIHHPLLHYPVDVGITVLISWLSFRYFESPFLILKDRYSRLRPTASEAAPTAVDSAATHTPVHP